MVDLSKMESGGASGAVDPASPLMAAWEQFKLSESYANSKKWAAFPEHVDGSLWVMFSVGFMAALNPEVPVPVLKRVEQILDEHSAWIAAPNSDVTRAVALAATVAAHAIIQNGEDKF